MGYHGRMRRGALRRWLATASLLAASSAGAESRLEFLGFLQNGDDGLVGLDGVYSSLVSGDGRFLYAAAVPFNWLSVYEIDPQTRLPRQVQRLQANRAGAPDDFMAPIDAILSPDERFLYVSAYVGKTLFIYSRDADTGLLTEVVQQSTGPIGEIGYLAQTADGLHLFAPGYDTNVVASIARNADTGLVESATFLFRPELPDPAALDGPQFCAISPDDRFVYVANAKGNSVSWFAVDPLDRTLSYAGIVKDGDPGVDNLLDTRWIAISGDGRFLYVTALQDNAVTVFERDIATGALTVRQSIRDDVRLQICRYVILSPDQSILMVNGYFGNTTIQFGRDAATGLLTEQAAYQNGFQPGALGLRETRDVSFSPDGEYVYFASWGDMGLGTYRLAPVLSATESWRLF